MCKAEELEVMKQEERYRTLEKKNLYHRQLSSADRC